MGLPIAATRPAAAPPALALHRPPPLHPSSRSAASALALLTLCAADDHQPCAKAQPVARHTSAGADNLTAAWPGLDAGSRCDISTGMGACASGQCGQGAAEQRAA